MTKRFVAYATTFALAFTLGLTLACATLQPKAPPNLTPQVTAAFYATYAIKDLDAIRDFADAASKTTPPMISVTTLLAVVDWHETLVINIHAAPSGWRALALAGLDALKTRLPAADYAKFKAYIDAARVFVTEVR